MRRNSRNGDLWSEIWNVASEIGFDNIQLIKVPSHVDVLTATDAIEAWSLINNASADAAAKAANRSRGTAFWVLWDQQAFQTSQQIELGKVVRKHIATVCRRWVSEYKQACGGDIDRKNTFPEVRQARVFAHRWEQPAEWVAVRRRGSHLFGSDLVQKFLSWFGAITIEVGTQVRWISFAQLFVAYQLEFQEVPVIKQSGKWRVVSQWPLAMPQNFRYRLLVKWFRLFAQQCLKDAEVGFFTVTTRAHSDWVACHGGCISIPLSFHVWDGVEQWFASKCRTAIVGQGKGLDSLPLAMDQG